MSSCVEATCRGLQAAPDEQVRQALASWLSENRPTAGFRDFISNQAEVRTTPLRKHPLPGLVYPRIGPSYWNLLKTQDFAVAEMALRPGSRQATSTTVGDTATIPIARCPK